MTLAGLYKHLSLLTVLYFQTKKNNTVVLPDTKAYPVGKVPIKKEKLQDLQKVIHYIPDEHRPFFQERLSWPTKTTAVANEVNEDD